MTTYEDNEVEYVVCTPEDNEKEEKRLRNELEICTKDSKIDIIR